MSNHPVKRRTAKPLNLLRAALLQECRNAVFIELEKRVSRKDKYDPVEDEAFVKAVHFIADIMERQEKEQEWLGSKPSDLYGGRERLA